MSDLCSSVVCPRKMAVPTLLSGADESTGSIEWSGVASSSVEYSLQRADLADSLSAFVEVYRGPSNAASVSLQSAVGAPAASLFLFRVKVVSTPHMDACCTSAWSEPLIVPAPMPTALLVATSTRGLAVAPNNNNTAAADSPAFLSEASNRTVEWVIVPCVVLGSMVVLMVSAVLYRWHRERRRARVNKALVEATNATTAARAVQDSLGRPPAIHIEVCPLPDIVVMSTHARPYALSHSIYSDGRTASVGEGVVAAHPLNDNFF